MEFFSIFSLILGLFFVFGGALIEGVPWTSLLQLTAALIVVGGTISATFLSFPKDEIKLAIKNLKLVFKKLNHSENAIADEILKLAMSARREGIAGLESVYGEIKNPLIKKYVKYLMDGLDIVSLEKIMDEEMEQELEKNEVSALVWEQASGFAPTMGILGAVLGLVHVLSSLKDDNTNLGYGIAVAFIATLYGVSFSNLVCLPISNQIKRQARRILRQKMIIKIGLQTIAEGGTPLLLKDRLEAFLQDSFKTQSSTVLKA